MRVLAPGLLVLALVLPAETQAQESATYVMRHASATAAATRTSSATFEMIAVLEQGLSGQTSACNAGFVNSIGFLSAMGILPVSNALRLDKDAVDRSTILLAWSGSDDMFEVFRSATPDNVVDPPNLFDLTHTCATSDPEGGTPGIAFYNVVPAMQAKSRVSRSMSQEGEPR